MVKVAERAPLPVGVKVTGIVTVPPLAATVSGTVAPTEKSPLFVPDKVRAVICTAEVVALVTVIGDAVLLLPTG
jgi:hypothetical protein